MTRQLRDAGRIIVVASPAYKWWTMRWKPALNAFEIAFDDRLAAGRK